MRLLTTQSEYIKKELLLFIKLIICLFITIILYSLLKQLIINHNNKLKIFSIILLIFIFYII